MSELLGFPESVVYDLSSYTLVLVLGWTRPSIYTDMYVQMILSKLLGFPRSYDLSNYTLVLGRFRPSIYTDIRMYRRDRVLGSRRRTRVTKAVNQQL